MEINPFLTMLFPPRLREGYGMTEMSPAVTFTDLNTNQTGGSCGQLLPNTRMKVSVEPNIKYQNYVLLGIPIPFGPKYLNSFMI